MTDLVRLVRDDHVRVGRLFGELEAAADSPERLSALWAELARFLLAHVDAFDEICQLPLLDAVPEAWVSMRDVSAEKLDIGDAVAETRLHPAGSLQWWLAVHAARAAADRHIDRIEAGILLPFAQRAPRSVRQELGRQFARFMADHAPAGRGGARPDSAPGNA